jgi:hypothetical protein
VLAQRIRQFRNSRQFRVTDDRFTNNTRITAGQFRLSGVMEQALTNTFFSVTAGFDFPNSRVVPPENFHLAFYSESRDWAFLEDATLLALIDGVSLNLGSAERQSDIERRGVQEFLGFRVPFETFNRIANAQSVEMRLGRREFRLRPEHLEAFRNLISLTQIPSAPSNTPKPSDPSRTP